MCVQLGQPLSSSLSFPFSLSLPFLSLFFPPPPFPPVTPFLPFSILLFPFFPSTQGATKRCRLSLLTNSALVLRVQNAGGGEGGSFGVSANEHSCAHHVTWSPNKLWRSASIFNLCFHPCQFVTPFSLLSLSSRLQYYHVHLSMYIVITFAFNI
jgi:hypothetical protein